MKQKSAAMNFKTFYLDNKEYYYIHRHISHFEKDSAISFFQEQKRKNYIQMRNRYRKNYLKNILSVNNESLEILNKSMEEQAIDDLDKQLLDTLNNNISSAIQNFNISKNAEIAYKALDSFINKPNAEAFDTILAQITAASELLTNDSEYIAALVGLQGQYINKNSLTKIYNLITKYINNWNNKQIALDPKRLVSVQNSLLKLISALKQKKGSVSKQSLQGYLRNIFSTQVGEYVVSKGTGMGLNMLINTVDNSLSGTKNIKVGVSKQDDKIIQQFGQATGTTRFKTDTSLRNLSINVNSTKNSIIINLGISTKQYMEGSVSKVFVTSETGEKSATFLHRLNQMLRTDTEMYYAYNALGLVNQDNSIYNALKAAMVARNADILISGLGIQGDFSQFIVINGTFYSIWDIIKAIEYFNEGSGLTDKESGTDIVTISAQGLSQIAKKTDEALKQRKKNLTKAFKRSKEQNEMMRDLKFIAHFYPNRLKNALPQIR